jgi:uncharacterized protein (TIGR04540 family)
VQKAYEKTKNNTILKNPTSIKMLARQIITASDDYISMKMDESQYRALIIYYAKNHGKKLFSPLMPGRLNPTVLNRIGKKRAELVKIMLSGYQMVLF